jgi:hypothetical protein
MDNNIKESKYFGRVYSKRIDGIYDKWKVLDVMDDDSPEVEFIVQSFGGVYKAIKKDELLNND